MSQSIFDFVRIAYSNGERKEGYLVDITDGVGTLQELNETATAFSVAEVVIDVQVPAEGTSVLINYPFEQDDVVIFRDNRDDIQGRFVRRADRQGGILVWAEGHPWGVRYASIIRVRKVSCEFFVPPIYRP